MSLPDHYPKPSKRYRLRPPPGQTLESWNSTASPEDRQRLGELDALMKMFEIGIVFRFCPEDDPVLPWKASYAILDNTGTLLNPDTTIQIDEFRYASLAEAEVLFHQMVAETQKAP